MIAVIELAIEQKRYSKSSIEMMIETLSEENYQFEDVNTSKIKAIANFAIPKPNTSRYDIFLGC